MSSREDPLLAPGPWLLRLLVKPELPSSRTLKLEITLRLAPVHVDRHRLDRAVVAHPIRRTGPDNRQRQVRRRPQVPTNDGARPGDLKARIHRIAQHRQCKTWQ